MRQRLWALAFPMGDNRLGGDLAVAQKAWRVISETC